MKKTLLQSLFALALTGFATTAALAQTGTSGTTFTATPSTQNVAQGGNFNISFTLNGTNPPANITAFDLYIVTASANSGFFTITSSTPTGPFNAFGPNIPPTGDPLSVAAASGFVRNNVDLGYSGPAQNPPYSISISTLNIKLNNAPQGTYTFFTSTLANAGQFYSDVADTNGGVYTVGQGSFQITVIPEPSTWALALLGLGVVGLARLRTRRTA